MSEVKKEEKDDKDAGEEDKEAETSKPHKEGKLKKEEEDSGEEAEEKKVEAKPTQLADTSELYSEPAFSVLCSYFNKFGALLGVKPYSFPKLETILTKLDASGRIDRELIELYVTLLRRIGFKSVRSDKWEPVLVRFCELRPELESEWHQLERFGFAHLPVKSKIIVLKALCEAQFDFNLRFKENILLSHKSGDLRLLPVGMDCNGLAYWYQQDSELNVRLYTEEQDDQSGETWQLIVRSPEELDKLIVKLKEKDLGYVKKQRGNESKKEEEKKKGEDEAKQGDNDGMTSKKGTFLDTFQDPETLRKKREAMEKAKLERKNKGGAVGTTKEEAGEKQEIHRAKKPVKEATPPAESAEEAPEEEISQDVPEDLKQFMDRRILPRRSARSAAVANIRSFVATPPKKKAETKKEDKKEEKAEEKEKAESDESSSDGSADSSSGEETEGVEEEESEEEKSSGDEFMPRAERIKKKGRKKRVARQDSEEPKQKRRRKKKRKAIFLEEEEDEEDDDGEEEVTKERKKATEETRCKKCKKSDHWEVLLLCDECDDAWHTWCLRPQLWFVPDDDWFCPKCLHGKLIERLMRVATALREQLNNKSIEDKKDHQCIKMKTF